MSQSVKKNSSLAEEVRPFLTSTQYWMAKLQGGGGVGKNSTLPLGHTTMDKQQSWREGFPQGDP